MSENMNCVDCLCSLDEECTCLSDVSTLFLKLFGIKSEDLLQLNVNEVLDILDNTSDGSTKRIGEHHFYIQKGEYNNSECIVVHSYRWYKVHGLTEYAYSVLGWVSPKFYTLEERHFLSIKQHGHTEEKVWLLLKENDEYHLRNQTTSLRRKDLVHRDICFHDMRGVVTKAPLLILQYLMSKQKNISSLIIPSLTWNGLPTTYTLSAARLFPCTGVGFLRKIQWGVQEQGSDELTPQVEWYYHPTTGQLMRMWYRNTPYAAVARPKIIRSDILNRNRSDISNRSEIFNEPDILKPGLKWENDMQLLSEYLNHKTLVEAQTYTYLKDYPQIREFLSDMIQTLLLCKPDDPIAFIVEFFVPQRLLRCACREN